MNLKELKDIAFRSSEYTKAQLQSIDTNLLIGSLFSLIVSFSLSVFLNILIYWIPSSFFLMFIWTLYAVFSTKKRNSRINNTDKKDQPNQKQKNFQVLTLFKNFTPFLNAICVLFAITFTALVIFSADMISTNFEFPKIVPMISTVLIFFVLFLNYRTISALEREQLSLFELPGMAMSLGCFKSCISLFISVGLAFISLVVFPIWSLVITHPIYATSLNNIPFLLLVIIFQMFTIAIFASYFSSISLKRELTNTLTNLSILDNIIGDYMINNSINEDRINELKQLYYKAKRYEFAVDDTLRLVNFYFLFPNKVYLDKLKD